jgi:hypothetical protein
MGHQDSNASRHLIKKIKKRKEGAHALLSDFVTSVAFGCTRVATAEPVFKAASGTRVPETRNQIEKRKKEVFLGL